MNRSLIMVAICFLMSLPVVAADSKAEVFAGFQYSRLDGADLNGWNASVSRNFTEHLGAAADFSGSYQSVGNINTKTYTYTFGPVISGRKDEPIVPFAHALFGGVHTSGRLGNITASASGFAMIIGGGLDYRILDKLSLRVAQFDWMSLHENGSTSNNNLRYSGGVVFHF